MKTTTFYYAKQLARENKRIKVPPSKKLDELDFGSLVKVSVFMEKFWVKIIKVENDNVTGIIDCALRNHFWHGLKFGDTVKFRLSNIYQIY